MIDTIFTQPVNRGQKVVVSKLWGDWWLLHGLPEDALAVLAGVQLAADVNPFGGAFGFEAELVEGDVVNEPVEPFVEC